MSVHYPCLLAAVVIDDANDTIKVIRSDPTTATIAHGTYFLRGDGAADDLALALQDALDDNAGDNNTYTVAVSTRAEGVLGVVTITRATGVGFFTIDGSDAGTTFDLALIGLTPTAHADVGGVVTSALSPAALWVGNEPAARSDPTFEAVGRQVRMTNGQVRTFDRGGPYDLREVELAFVDAERTLVEATPTDEARAFQSFWRLARDGRAVEFHELEIAATPVLEDMDSTTLVDTYVLDETASSAFRPRRFDPGLALYGWALGLRGYVA
jgi:hypothetical protein